MDYMYSADANALGWLAFFISGFGLVIALLFYVYYALALMSVAKRTNTANGWFAWIPILNLYLMTQIGKVPWWTLLVFLVAWIPVVGYLAVLAVTIWWWWKIAEARSKPGWWGLLIALVPVVNLVFLGLLAWGNGTSAVKATE